MNAWEVGCHNDDYAAAVLRKTAETLTERKITTPLTVNGCIKIIAELADAYEKRAKETK